MLMILLYLQWQYYKAWMRRRIQRALGLPRTPYMQALAGNCLPTSTDNHASKALLTSSTGSPGQHDDAQLLVQASEDQAVNGVAQPGRQGSSRRSLPDDVMDALLTKVRPGQGFTTGECALKYWGICTEVFKG
jgi:hypothetical protein